MRTTSGLFNFIKKDDIMELKQHQPPMNIDNQIANLKTLGLKIKNEEKAKCFLNDVSYYRFIKAFSLGLKDNNSNYYPNVTFEQITELYLFNSNFRQLLFPQIERIEINLRCRISNYFSCKYGVLGYEDSNNFQNPQYHQIFLEEINHEIDRNSKSPFVKNFKDNYVSGKLPMYALVELFSFGTLSKFFKNLHNDDKKAIANTFGIGYTYLESWFEHLSFIRNICAHYGRLYNATFPKTPTLYKQYSKQNIGNRRIYATLICIKHLSPNDRHWNEFIETISLLIEKYSNINIEYMGFPENWKEILSEN